MGNFFPQSGEFFSAVEPETALTVITVTTVIKRAVAVFAGATATRYLNTRAQQTAAHTIHLHA